MLIFSSLPSPLSYYKNPLFGHTDKTTCGSLDGLNFYLSYTIKSLLSLCDNVIIPLWILDLN